METFLKQGGRLLVVDGLAVAYRAFFAIRGLSTRDGRPTNALFGFVKMLRRLDEAWRPTHWGVVFDGGLPASRLTLLPEYKAQRPPMPDALKGQLDACRRYLRIARVSEMTLPDEEADDAIASVARQAEKTMDETLIATGDKDMYQLVNARTRLVPVSGNERVAWGPDEIVAKTGVAPERIVDWLALVGDSADNIPGVPGIGPKTAARLLNEFGSLANLLAQAESLRDPKTKASLVACRERALRNVEMIRLRTDAAPAVVWEQWVREEPDPVALVKFFEEMEFDSLAAESRQQNLF